MLKNRNWKPIILIISCFHLLLSINFIFDDIWFKIHKFHLHSIINEKNIYIYFLTIMSTLISWCILNMNRIGIQWIHLNYGLFVMIENYDHFLVNVRSIEMVLICNCLQNKIIFKWNWIYFLLFLLSSCQCIINVF